MRSSPAAQESPAAAPRDPSAAAEFVLARDGRAPIFLTARIFFFFLLIDLAFWAFGFQKVYQQVQRRCNRRPPRGADLETDELVRKTFRGVLAATTFYYRKRKDCLPRALAVYYFLRRKGVPAMLRIGVKRFPFAGHAWVEYRGSIIDISPEIALKYTPLTSPQ